MAIKLFLSYALCLSAASSLAACSERQLPSVLTSSHADSVATLQRTPVGRSMILANSWMSPEAKAVKKLLYVSDYDTGNVYVFSYGTGSLLGALSGVNGPQGQCVDARGNVWITALGSVVEYAHGQIWPTKTLTTNGYGSGCSVSRDGDLAVANSAPESGSGPGDVQVWRHATGSPLTYYSNECPAPAPPGYDDDGNLYFQSVVYDGPQLVCLLPRGAKHIRQVSFDRRIDAAGSIQWDGKQLALTDSDYKQKKVTAIYRVQELRSGDLKLVGRTVLDDSCVNGYENEEYWLFIVGNKNTPVSREEGQAVVGGNMLCNNRVSYWSYPGGGNPTKSLSAAPTHPQGEAVSIAP